MERFFQLDGNILLWIQQYIRCDLLTTFFRFFTTLGEGGAIWIAIAITDYVCPTCTLQASGDFKNVLL